MNLLVTVDMTQVLASLIERASNVRGIEIGGWDGTKVVSSPWCSNRCCFFFFSFQVVWSEVLSFLKLDECQCKECEGSSLA